MVATLVILLILVVFLAFFVGKNLGHVCTFWLFKTFENLPVAVLVLIAFGAGIVCSILFVLVAKIRAASTADLNAQIENQKMKLSKKAMKEEKRRRKEKNVSVVPENNADNKA